MFPDRKAFNFFKSYWTIAKELDDKSRLEFYDALLKKQFTGEDSELTGMAKFAYISQKHSIDSQLYGLKSREGRLGGTAGAALGGTAGAALGGTAGAEPQEKEEVKEEEKYNIPPVGIVIDFKEEKPKEEKINFDGLLKQFNLICGRNFKVVTEKTKSQFKARLKDGYSKSDILKAIKNCYADPYHIETNHKFLTLEFISRPDKMEKYATDTVKAKTTNKKEIGML